MFSVFSSSSKWATYTHRVFLGLACLFFPLLGAGQGIDSTSVLSSADSVSVGYGLQTNQIKAGALQYLGQKQFNGGFIPTPEELITGRVAGVQITSTSGAPGADHLFVWQGATTLHGKISPLVVVDGMLLNEGFKERNPLFLLNPQDIASIVFLKDPATTSLYGARGVNGVLLVTTKRGTSGDKIRLNYQVTASVSALPKKVSVLSASDFTQAILKHGSREQQALLGKEKTDWQDEIYKKAFSQAHDLSVGGQVGTVPYRLSVGTLRQNGILTNSDFKRTTTALSLHPSLFENHLKINLSLQGMVDDSRPARERAVEVGTLFDPTQPVFDKETGEYFEWRDKDGKIAPFTPVNPVKALAQSQEQRKIQRGLGTVGIEYALHFFPALRVGVQFGWDFIKGREKTYSLEYSSEEQKGVKEHYSQTKKDNLQQYYLSFNKEFTAIQSQVEFTAGHSKQTFTRDLTSETYAWPQEPDNRWGTGEYVSKGYWYLNNNFITAEFGQLHYTYKKRYSLTASARNDASSQFVTKNQNFLSSGIGLGWLVSEEDFFQHISFLHEVKVRGSYGRQGNSPVIDYFNPFIGTIAPTELEWEKTFTYAAGLDFSFKNGVKGSLDYFSRTTDDMLLLAPMPYDNGVIHALLNKGSLKNSGWELSLSQTWALTANSRWTWGVNASYFTNQITSLPPQFGVFLFNRNIINREGQATNSIYTYQQQYANGKPVQGKFEDLNQDGTLDLHDTKLFESSSPKSILGISSHFAYQGWSFAFLAKAHLGFYRYNYFDSWYGSYTSGAPNHLTNVSASVLKTDFTILQNYSDLYIEEASFLRMENIQVGYEFGRHLKSRASIQLLATLQNAFVLTKYTGQDPEVVNANPLIQYPRARTFSLSVRVGL